jgi:hypothetical protein
MLVKTVIGDRGGELRESGSDSGRLGNRCCATVTGVTVTLVWQMSTNASIAILGARAYVGSAPVGTELVNTVVGATAIPAGVAAWVAGSAAGEILTDARPDPLPEPVPVPDPRLDPQFLENVMWGSYNPYTGEQNPSWRCSWKECQHFVIGEVARCW